MILSDISFNGPRSEGDLSWSPTGDLAVASKLPRLKEALIRSLITNTGTLLHRPSYGAGLLQYQNAPLSIDMQQRLVKLISSALVKDPEVTSVNEVSLSEATTPNGVLIRIRVSAGGYENVSFDFRPFNALVG